mgnify:CR=1 FL=1
MNGRKARELRRQAVNRREYQVLKSEAHRDQGQRPKFEAERRRRTPARHGPSWPATMDQRKQSRPLIVIRPLKHLTGHHPPDKGVAHLCGRLSKCAVDWAVLAGWSSP